MYEYLVDLFPQAAGSSQAPPPPRALFEDFFAPPSSSHQPVYLAWFERVSSTLSEADSWIAVLLASGRPRGFAVASLFHSVFRRWRCLSVFFARPSILASRFGKRRFWRLPPVLFRNHSHMQCGCCLGSWGSWVFRGFRLRTLPCLTPWLRPCRNA